MALKEIGTKNLYQSTFMPIFEKAQAKIKSIIVLAFLLYSSARVMRMQINAVIQWVADNIPKTLKDRDIYLKSLEVRANNFIRLYYLKPLVEFKGTKKLLLNSLKNRDDIKEPKIDNPKDLIDLIQDKRNLWSEAKGIPNVVDYEKKVKEYIYKLSRNPVTTVEKGKQPISLWQKAELDIRYDSQMEMVNKFETEGVEYAYISSHPDCSVRCEVWQGELVAINKHAKNPQTHANQPKDIVKSRFEVGRLDGHIVYSLPDLMDVVDKYGYKNNCICGFNCRHKLIRYHAGRIPPTEYTKGEIAQQRAVETHIRQLEREIRCLKTELVMYNSINDRKEVYRLEKIIQKRVSHYKKYCENNGYAYFEYRINVM